MTDAFVSRAAERLQILIDELAVVAPDKITEAKGLAGTLCDPATASADECWEKMWDKPLWANARVESVKRKLSFLTPYFSGQWQNIVQNGGRYHIEKVGAGILRDAYVVHGDIAQEIVAAGVARHRLFAIAGASRALRERSKRNAPFADIVDMPLSEIVPVLKSEFGAGWGHISVLHFLTDMGLAIKPDLHVVKTMQHLGFQLSNTKRKVPSLSDALDLFDIVRSLTVAIKGDEAPASLREVDYLLMQISVQLLNPTLTSSNKVRPRSRRPTQKSK